MKRNSDSLVKINDNTTNKLQYQIKVDNKKIASQEAIFVNEPAIDPVNGISLSLYIGDKIGCKKQKDLIASTRLFYTMYKDILNATPKNSKFKNKDRLIFTSQDFAAVNLSVKMLGGYMPKKELFFQDPILFIEKESQNSNIDAMLPVRQAVENAGAQILLKEFMNKNERTEMFDWKPYDYNVYLFVSPEEIDEPKTVEVLKRASKFGLSNLRIIIPTYNSNPIYKLSIEGFDIVKTKLSKLAKRLEKDLSKPTIFVVKDLITKEEEKFFEPTRTIPQISKFYNTKVFEGEMVDVKSEEVEALRKGIEDRNKDFADYWKYYHSQIKSESKLVRDLAKADINQVKNDSLNEYAANLINLFLSTEDFKLRLNGEGNFEEGKISLPQIQEFSNLFEMFFSNIKQRLIIVDDNEKDISKYEKLLSENRLKGQILIYKYKNDRQGLTKMRSINKILKMKGGWNIFFPGNEAELVEAFYSATRTTAKPITIAIPEFSKNPAKYDKKLMIGNPSQGIYMLRKRKKKTIKNTISLVAFGSALDFSYQLAEEMEEKGKDPQLVSLFNHGEKISTSKIKDEVKNTKTVNIALAKLKEEDDYILQEIRDGKWSLRVNMNSADDENTISEIAEKIVELK